MNVKQKKVSVLVPCYNGEEFVDRCMQSIIIQDCENVECIVVDDGSTDSSKEKIQAWKDAFEEKGWELIYFYQENQGLGAAINAGLKLISGAYLILLDIDDEFLEGALNEKRNYLEKHLEVDVVRSNGWTVSENNKYLFITDSEEKNIEDLFDGLILGKTNNWAGSYMIRTQPFFEFYPNRDIYTSRYGQNLQLLLPLVYKQTCGFIDKPHMNYNRQPNSLSQSNNWKEKKKKELDNIKGYADIRNYMVKLIVKDKNEQLEYLKKVQQYYWQAIMSIALNYGDKELMRVAYDSMKEVVKPTLDNKITYYMLQFPMMAYYWKMVRKLKRLKDGR